MELERTGPHRDAERLLDRMGIAYASEIPVDAYQLDIYLPEFHACIEIDGLGHYPKRDNRRDRYLFRHYGIPTLRTGRLSEHEVIQYLEEWAGSTDQRRVNALDIR